MDVQQQNQSANNPIDAVRKNSAVIQVYTEPANHNVESRSVKYTFFGKRAVHKKSVKHPLNCLTLCNHFKRKGMKPNKSDATYSYTNPITGSNKVQNDFNGANQPESGKNGETVDEGKSEADSHRSRLHSFPLKHTSKCPEPVVSTAIQCADQSKTAGDDTTVGHPRQTETTSVTSEPSTPRSRNTVDTNDANVSMESHKEIVSSDNVITSKDMMKSDSMEQSNSSDEKSLKHAVEHCERRLERLYGRLIWLRDSTSLSATSHNFADNCPEMADVTLGSKIEPPNKSLALESVTDMEALQKQVAHLSLKMHDIKCQIEAFSFLSWIGLLQEPHTNRMPVPGIRAPPPNPKLYLTRRPDSDARNTAREYKRLCEQSISDPVRFDLRRVTFNNWPWSDAWLIRFVRQMFVDLGFVEHFKLPLKRMDTWLCDIYRRYNRVPFHNYKHAFMVTQMCYALMWNANLVEFLDREDQMTLIISAICHDLDHPGFNNAYQINVGTELAMRYNDQSPLENHHCSMAFDILSHSEANPFENLDPETMKRIRDGVIRCILATDMSRHNEIVNQFTSVVLSDLEYSWHIDEETKQPYWAIDKSKRDLVMMILIKVCDISNEARPLTVAGPWIDRLLAEFFHQSDYEKLVGLPVAPFMDREKVTKSASQCGFIRFVILPLFESLAKLLPPVKSLLVQPAIEQLNHYTEMQILDEQQKREQDDEQDDPKTVDSNGREDEQS